MSESPQTELQRAAIAWWHGKRPVNWNLYDHLANPTVNCTSDRERALALAIADITKD